MPVPEKEIDKTREEIASSKDDDKERITETGYFYLSQQINFNTQQITRLDNKIDRLDEKLETQIARLDNKIDKLDEKIDSVRDSLENKVDSLKFWAVGTVIAVLVGTGGIIATLAVLFT